MKIRLGLLLAVTLVCPAAHSWEFPQDNELQNDVPLWVRPDVRNFDRVENEVVENTDVSEEPSDSPDIPTQEPVDPSDNPVEPSDNPVEPSDNPVDPSDNPVEPTEEPVEPSEEPVTNTNEPDTSTNEPAASPTPTDPTSEVEAQELIDYMESEMRPLLVEAQEADWMEAIDHTDEHVEASNAAHEKYNKEFGKYWNSVIDFYKFEDFKPSLLKRRFELNGKPGTSALSIDEQTQLANDTSSMNEFSLQRVCPYTEQDCDAEGDTAMSMDVLEGVLAVERDTDALEYYWKTWRDLAGAPTKPFFADLVRLENKAARDDANGFTDATDMWLQDYIAPDYTTQDFTGEVDRIWNRTKVLYGKIHSYVRYRLRNSEVFKDKFGKTSPIPAHLLGNMYGQDWQNIYDLVAPYPNISLPNITQALTDNIGDVEEMFDLAEGFFKSLNLYNLTFDFHNKSYLEQKDDMISVCHASAWDFFSVTEKGAQKDGDFRIKMCTDKNQEDFIVMHHEMGHTQYQMAYSQVSDNNAEAPPIIFRDGANPGFHEAIGDTIALSVSTPSHLEKINNHLTGKKGVARDDDADTNYKRDINQLMRAALEKVTFIPYAYILDKFRWDVFSGIVTEEEYNYHWWKLRVEKQGLKPPVPREKSDDFDPGCKFHVANNVPYIRYFVSYILQYQFHEKLCSIRDEAENITTTIYDCDIYDSVEAGNALKDMLVKGNTFPWTETLSAFLGTQNDGLMSADSIITYFKPLEDWLDKQQSELGYDIGWDTDIDQYFVQHIPATVPIVVGIVLAVMIVIVVVAYFVGKKRQAKKTDKMVEVEEAAGHANTGFELGEKKHSVSSSSSSSSADSK